MSQPNLEATILDLARYGRCSLSLLSTGWHCRVEMNTNTTGSSFAVASGFNQASPTEAVEECAKRVAQALAALGSSPNQARLA